MPSAKNQPTDLAATARGTDRYSPTRPTKLAIIRSQVKADSSTTHGLGFDGEPPLQSGLLLVKVTRPNFQGHLFTQHLDDHILRVFFR
jgi:hypothetical protein